MAAPKLFFGCLNLTDLLLADSSYRDSGVAYNLLATTDRLAPSGMGGESAFYTLYVAIEHEAATPIRVTPIVDGVALDPVDVTLPLPSARAIRVVEVPIRVRMPASVANYLTKARFAPRGTWIQAKVESLFAVGSGALAASLSTALTGVDNDLVFTAKTAGLAGNSITVAYINPGTNNAALSVSVTGTAITVNLATNGSAAITSTAQDIKAAIEANGTANALVAITVKTSDSTGSYALLATNQGQANDDLLFTARTPGAPGASVRIAYINNGPLDSLSIVVSGSDITVHNHTDAGNVSLSTASDIKGLIEAYGPANSLVSVALKAGNNGTGIPGSMAFANLKLGNGVVTAMAAAALAGGVDVVTDVPGGFTSVHGVEVEHEVLRESMKEGVNK